MQQNSIVITGATGFIGSNIARLALLRGYSVIAVHQPDSDFGRIHDIIGALTLISAKIPTKHLIHELKKHNPIAWIDCAWYGVSGKERNAQYQVSYNVPRVIKFVQIASNVGCSTWIGFGSQAEYGNQNCVLDENACIKPTTLYGMAKLSAGWAARGMGEALGIRYIWLRIFSIYGPGDHGYWFIPYLVRSFLSDVSPKLTSCEQLWDYLYIIDAAEAVLACLESDGVHGIYNLGSGKPVLLRRVVEIIRNLCDSDIAPDFGAIPYRTDQVMHLEADITKLCTDTNWRPSTDIREGLRSVVEYAKKGYCNQNGDVG